MNAYKSLLTLLVSLILSITLQAQRRIKWGNKWLTCYDCKPLPPQKINELNIDTLEKEGKITIAKTDTNAVSQGSNDSNHTITIPNIKYGQVLNLQWKPVAYFHNQLFPSAIISLANYKGASADNISEVIKKPLGFYILSNKSNIPIRWEIECVDKNYFDKVSGYFTYKDSNQLTFLQIDIPWNFKALLSNITPAPVNIFFRLYDIYGNKSEKLITVTLRSINDCIYKYKNLNLDFEFSAFVQKDDTAINAILKDAIKSKMIDAFIGYQKDSNYVDKQVAVIWRLLYNRGFSFTNVPVSNRDLRDTKDSIYSLPVHTFQNALKAKVESTLDGTIIFASILKQIGLNPVLVLASGHCLLGYYVDDQSIHYLEIGLLSNHYISYNNKLVDVLANAKTLTEKSKAFSKLFDFARKEGDLEFNKTDVSQRTIVDISSCRRYISPLPVYN